MTTGEPSVLRSDAQANHDRILTAARTVFADHGLDAKLADVAEAAGVGVGTIYRRFTNKEGLVEALFASRLRELATVASQADEMDDAWAGLVHILHQGSRMMADDHGLRDLMLPTRGHTDPPLPLASLTNEVISARYLLIELSSRIVQRAKDSGDLRTDFSSTDIPVLILAVQTASDFARPRTDDMWQRMLGFAIDGLRTSRDAPTTLAVSALSHAEMDKAMGTKYSG